MNDGFTADLYLKSNEQIDKSIDRKEKNYGYLLVALATAVGLVTGYTVVNVFNPSEQPIITPNYEILNVTKSAYIGNKLGTVWPSTNLTWVDGGIDFARGNNGDTYIHGEVIAFTYTNLTPPNTFTSATLSFPLGWFSSWGEKGPWGKVVGNWTDMNFSLSIYEIRKAWPTQLTSPGVYTPYISWSILNDATYMDRNTLSTISNINKLNNGFGDTTHGNITFDITRAITDWKSGIWNPANGFLITVVAPWESVSPTWLNMTGLIYYGMTLHWQMIETQMQINFINQIPEFPSIIIPIGMMMVMAVIFKRKKNV